MFSGGEYDVTVPQQAYIALTVLDKAEATLIDGKGRSMLL
jgi:hypothetical protein